MRDLYKRLGLEETSGDAAIRAAAAAADAETREAAEFILLDPRRREVYDRNRRLLLTVGRLRANLGLNLTRFWPRARFGDFTVDLAPPPQARPRYLDPMAMAWALGVRPPRTGRGRRAGARWVLAAAALAAVLAAILLLLPRG